ncbi:CmpA/NrtA family ABC transporter substrate-binding protein [Oharaeibacter diazotrophicus]|uniref:NitT/TauT family transport system ATP-binding protein n=2 Tax=Oharaeibacter diazotrophicus TaxID=1920512 RepID=A0A4R6RA01_9HYPH|nr:CmpA/NrtA family ABC transporter substrate-binding protein [Oharaeibacter diazotrophicus]TDP82774.1 NitT/TauT family transport system ATP-binding protein [Oharaeibacter diazotrophicus]BBE72464.1 nitrate transporter [Pleomorphomonas sp. SM30]GLS76495.1 ABC transporter substrate-binding protein [Oharaeibacter diazotrophicus]
MLADDTHEGDDRRDTDAGAEAADGGATIRAGFIPLTDCAPLAVAARLGFAAAEGVRIDLVRQTSWASLRDRLAIGLFDVAQMLAPMPIAANLGVGGIPEPMIVPMALSRGGNAITVSTALWRAMTAAGARPGAGPAALGAALRKVVRAGRPPMTFGMVHPFSAHNYALRYWLSASGIDPDADVRLVVVPPPYAVEALESGQVDGFCVGEPWNTVAAARGVGVVALAASEIWTASPCKVLGMRAAFAERHPARAAALVRALVRAGRWADDPANRRPLAELLAAPDLVGADAGLIEDGLAGRLPDPAGAAPRAVPDFIAFAAGGATFPRRDHALWFYGQMVRWGQVPASADAERAAAATYRPDIHRAALAGAGEGEQEAVAVDGFFDGRVFDPDDVAGYVAGFRG